MTFQPTAEQQEALRLFATGKSLAIEAGAGAGKTSTLKLLAESTTRRGQYVAFNRAIVDESKLKMPQNVRCHTAHALAMRECGRDFQARLRSHRLKSMEIANLLRLDAIHLTTDEGARKQLSRSYLAGVVMNSITRFCQSADEEPTWRHMPRIEGIDSIQRWDNNREVAKQLEPAMRRAWADLKLKDGQGGKLTYRHDHYLKLWQLSGPRISADFILFDEAQDANPVMVAIVAAQTHAQLVWVGDSQQQIYTFTGAVNALAQVPAEQRAFLTQSFRFGPAVADVANRLLGALRAELRITGSGGPSTVRELADPDVVLTRTNAAAVRRLLQGLKAGMRPHLVGGGADVISFAKAAAELQRGEQTWHPELACFDSWGEVQAYVEEDEQGGELRLLVTLVDEFGVDRILEALEQMPREEDATFVVSTAHKAKGREWDAVQLGDDFPEDPKGEELRLLYVSVTRARRVLDISAVPYLSSEELAVQVALAEIDRRPTLTRPLVEGAIAKLDELLVTLDAAGNPTVAGSELGVDHASPAHDHASCVACVMEARDAEVSADFD